MRLINNMEPPSPPPSPPSPPPPPPPPPPPLPPTRWELEPMHGSADPSIMQADAFRLVAAPHALSSAQRNTHSGSARGSGGGGNSHGDGGGCSGDVHNLGDSGAWFGRFRNSDMERGMLVAKIRPSGSRTSVVVATAHLESPTDKVLHSAALHSMLPTAPPHSVYSHPHYRSVF